MASPEKLEARARARWEHQRKPYVRSLYAVHVITVAAIVMVAFVKTVWPIFWMWLLSWAARSLHNDIKRDGW